MMFARTSLSQSEFVHLIGPQREDPSKLGAGSASPDRNGRRTLEHDRHDPVPAVKAIQRGMGLKRLLDEAPLEPLETYPVIRRPRAGARSALHRQSWPDRQSRRRCVITNTNPPFVIAAREFLAARRRWSRLQTF
jgi:hypothetical protein